MFAAEILFEDAFLTREEPEIEKLDKITLHYEESFLFLLQWIFSFSASGSEIDGKQSSRVNKNKKKFKHQLRIYSNSYPIFIRHDDSVIFPARR